MLICFSSVFVFATAARPRYETFFFLKLKKWELGKNLELKLRFLLLTLRGGWARPLPLHISDERLAAHHQPRRWLEQRDQGAGLVIFKFGSPGRPRRSRSRPLHRGPAAAARELKNEIAAARK